MRDCDRRHKCYPRTTDLLPTRLLDITNSCHGFIRLLDRTRVKSGPYAALSHRWGPPGEHSNFGTYRSNIDEHSSGILVEHLPKTFQDAVCVTHSLGLQLLWIDSLCIVQDDPDDWETESKLMERVFSSAYCTIAASCAAGNSDGFLKPRPERSTVLVNGPANTGAMYYVCETIDDFNHDVEQSELNQRGWVLQERALSRRTIYFTERQSYWECGEGVRCETMTVMKKFVSRYVQLLLNFIIRIRGSSVRKTC